jgi:hypothetical protein
MMHAQLLDFPHFIFIAGPFRVRKKLIQPHLENMIVSRCSCLKASAELA